MAFGRFRFGLDREGDSRFDRHGAANHKALIVGIVQVDRVCCKHVRDDIAFTQFPVFDTIHHVRMRGMIYLVEHSDPPGNLCLARPALVTGVITPGSSCGNRTRPPKAPLSTP